jgi:tRNA/tmRNA/rRNA uracil-C5-methylase (TrmA/RlmC/RlmD family)
MRGFALGCGLFQWRSETLGFGVYPFPTIHHAQRSTSERTFQMNQEPQDLSASNPRRRKLPSLKPSSLTSKPGIIQAEANVHSIADAIIQNRFENDVQPLQSAMNSSIGCEHFGTCPGCSVMDQVDNVDVIRSARLYFDSLARQKLMVPPFRGRISKSDVLDDHQNQFRVVIPNESVRHWRTQAKLVVAASASKNPWSKSHNGAGCVFGLYQRNSHSVVSIPQCQVHHPAINQAIQYLEAATAKVQTPACMDESSKSGSSTATVTLRTGLRYVQLQVERTTGKVCLTLVWFSRDVKETQPALSRLTKELMKSQPQLWHSIWLHTHDGLGNNIFSRAPQSSWHLLCGPELLREPLPAEDDARIGFDKSGKRVPWLYFSPQTFRQANLDGFEVLALHVARAVPPSAKVCELYAGVGVLGLTALYYNALQNTSLTWLRCSDENPSNSRCFYRAVNSL